MTIINKIFILLCLTILIAGCGKQTPPTEQKETTEDITPPSQPSISSDLLDIADFEAAGFDMTGLDKGRGAAGSTVFRTTGDYPLIRHSVFYFKSPGLPSRTQKTNPWINALYQGLSKTDNIKL
ncbi:hypothetical protein JW968_01040 [Candidatus Woesearchaeota archaeon]|nr:hypothetical protein [Candidatus Woesearchaeota archaeon]